MAIQLQLGRQRLSFGGWGCSIGTKHSITSLFVVVCHLNVYLELHFVKKNPPFSFYSPVN
jgi:hypothetical protein